MNLVQSVRKAVPYCLGLVFLVGATYKGLDPAGALSALTSLGLAQVYAKPVIFSVVAIELYFGFNLFRPLRQRRFAHYSVYLLGVFTVFLIKLKTLGANSCGCLGVESLPGIAVNPVLFGILRNIGLIVAAEWYVWHAAAELENST